MDYTPFYLLPVPEDGIDKLFVNRESEIKTAKQFIATEKVAIIGVLGGPGTGKSSLLNVISSICKEKNIGVVNLSAREYPNSILPGKGAGLITGEGNGFVEYSVILIDDLNNFEDDNVIEFYRKISREKRIVFFADNLKRSADVLQERQLLTTHGSIVLPENLGFEECEKFLRKRLENFGEKYRFTRDSISLAVKRSNGNLRSFLKYCGRAWILTDKNITLRDMQNSILKVDEEIIYALSDTEKKVIRLLNKKILNVTQIRYELQKMKVNIARPTLEARLATLEQLGLLRAEKKGFELRYTTIYSEIGIELPENF